MGSEANLVPPINIHARYTTIVPRNFGLALVSTWCLNLETCLEKGNCGASITCPFKGRRFGQLHVVVCPTVTMYHGLENFTAEVNMSRVLLNLGCGLVAPLAWQNYDASWHLYLSRYPVLDRSATIEPG